MPFAAFERDAKGHGMSEEIRLACIRELHEVLLRYDAELHYTIDDDGIHLVMDGVELAVFFTRAELAQAVQAADDRLQKAALGSGLAKGHGTMSEWIAVGEKLPADGQIVLVCAGEPEFPHQTDAEFKGGKFFAWHTYEEDYVDLALRVTHWMPMPEPPVMQEDSH